MDVLEVYYQAYLSPGLASACSPVMLQIFRRRNVSMEARPKVRRILKQLQEKTLTTEGKARKQRLVEKVVIKITYTKQVLNLYAAVLPLLKKYIMFFQTKQTLVHKLHQNQEQMFLDFLGCFVKQEHLFHRSTRQLTSLDLSKKGGLLLDNKKNVCWK